MIGNKWFWTMVPMIIGFVAPALVILVLQICVGDFSLADSVRDIYSRQFSRGDNLFMLTLLGLVPFVPLSLLVLLKFEKFPPAKLACLGGGGLLGILALMIPGHVAVWYPLYGGGDTSSTAVIAFFFIPFYCLASLAIGLLLGHLTWRIMARRQAV